MDVDVIIVDSGRPEEAAWPRVYPQIQVVNLRRKIGSQLTPVEV
jgi:hypothetical protein